jgi:hypothetical protein
LPFIHLAAVLARTQRTACRFARQSRKRPARSRPNRTLPLRMSLVQTARYLPQASRAIQHIRFRSRTMTQLSYERETFVDDNPARIDGGYGRQVNHLEPSLIFSAAIGSGYHMLKPLGTDSSAGQRVRTVFDPVDPSCLLRNRA